MAYAPQRFNATGRGNARYDLSGLQRRADGRYTDGTWTYSEDGLSWDRPDTFVQGLPGQDSQGDYNWDPFSGKSPVLHRGGGGGGSFAPNMGTYGFDLAKAKLAYDRAVTRKNEGTQRLNKSMGFQRVGDKTQIDPYNQYGALQMLLGRQGSQLDDSWAAAAERGVGHRGLGAQGERALRFMHGAETSDLGTQYQLAYKQYLQDEADALAEYELAQQMGMYDAIGGGSYDYGDYPPYEEQSPYGDFRLAPRGPEYLFGGVDKLLSKPKKLATAVVKSKKTSPSTPIAGTRAPILPKPAVPAKTPSKKTSKKGGV